MWVNYAQNHTGFVLGFNANAPFFQEGVLDQVIYEPKPADTSKERACFYKHADWSYEKEWRNVRDVGQSGSRLVAIEPDVVTEIIFGWQIEQPNIARIMRRVTAWEMNPAFFQSSPSVRKPKFINTPKEVKGCQHCSGKGYLIADRH